MKSSIFFDVGGGQFMVVSLTVVAQAIKDEWPR